MQKQELTKEEWDLIKTLRDYRKAYPNGARMLEMEINDLVDILMDIEYQEEQEEDKEEEN